MQVIVVRRWASFYWQRDRCVIVDPSAGHFEPTRATDEAVSDQAQAHRFGGRWYCARGEERPTLIVEGSPEFEISSAEWKLHENWVAEFRCTGVDGRVVQVRYRPLCTLVASRVDPTFDYMDWCLSDFFFSITSLLGGTHSGNF